MKQKTITLDYQTRKRIVELLAVRESLLANRRAELSSLAVLFYGLAMGTGFVLVMSIIKTSELFVALILLPFAILFLYVALRLEKEKRKNLVKIKLR